MPFGRRHGSELRPSPCAMFVAMAILLAGCGQVDRTAEFIPSPTVALSILTSAMEAWKDGEPSGPVPGTKPVVFVVDSHRKADRPLVSYEILGEVPGNAPRTFAVKAQLDHPELEERLRYVIVGIDPLWVFRQEDYDLLCHWEHPMPDTKSPEVPPKAQ